MKSKIILREIKRNKLVTCALILFAAISAMLSAGAVDLAYSLHHSAKAFFEKSLTPDYIQMHSGDVDEEALDSFVREHSYILDMQIVHLLNINGTYLKVSQTGESESESVIDNAFVTQNDRFDFILNQNNEVVSVSDGEIAVPMYHVLKYGLSIGDTVLADNGKDQVRFTVSAFARDSQMNASFISSKRFVISDSDYQRLQSLMGSEEHIIEFRLSNVEKINQLEQDYKEAQLPASGPAVTISMIRIINSVIDIVIAAISLLAAFITSLIAIICVRFTIATSIHEDLMEIAVMKGIGLPPRYIGDLYFSKYAVIAGIGGSIGFLISYPLGTLLKSNLNAYMGIYDGGFFSHTLRLVAVIGCIWLLMLMCKGALKTFEKLDVVSALQTSGQGTRKKQSQWPSLYVARPKRSISLVMAVKYMILYKKPGLILIALFALFACLVILPLNLTMTFLSPGFIAYMGTPVCDIRADFQNIPTLSEDCQTFASLLDKDEEVDVYAVCTTYSCTALSTEREDVSLSIEIGNSSAFPLAYTTGRAPNLKTEIALSALAANNLNKVLGDTVQISNYGEETQYTVCGIYQDLTNGGKSAKALWTLDSASAIRAVFYVNLKEGIDSEAKKNEYRSVAENGRITDVQEYVSQSMGDMISQMKRMTAILCAASSVILLFVVAAFTTIFLLDNQDEISIMRGLGVSCRELQTLYTVRIFFSALCGILCGILLIVLLGEKITGLFTASMGIFEFSFITNAVLSYAVCPLVLLLLSVFSVWFTAGKIQKMPLFRI